MPEYYVFYSESGAPHVVHKEGCPDMDRASCVHVGDFKALQMALAAARNLVSGQAIECLKCSGAHNAKSGNSFVQPGKEFS